MMRLKARRSFRYAGRRLEVDEEFDTKSERDGVLLVAVGSAANVDLPKPRRGRPPKVTQVETPEPPKVVADDFPPPDEMEAGRFYNRRDMEAE